MNDSKAILKPRTIERDDSVAFGRVVIDKLHGCDCEAFGLIDAIDGKLKRMGGAREKQRGSHAKNSDCWFH